MNVLFHCRCCPTSVCRPHGVNPLAAHPAHVCSDMPVSKASRMPAGRASPGARGRRDCLRLSLTRRDLNAVNAGAAGYFDNSINATSKWEYGLSVLTQPSENGIQWLGWYFSRVHRDCSMEASDHDADQEVEKPAESNGRRHGDQNENHPGSLGYWFRLERVSPGLTHFEESHARELARTIHRGAIGVPKENRVCHQHARQGKTL